MPYNVRVLVSGLKRLFGYSCLIKLYVLVCLSGNDILCSENICLPSAESFLAVDFVVLSFAILAGVFKGIWPKEGKRQLEYSCFIKLYVL